MKYKELIENLQNFTSPLHTGYFSIGNRPEVIINNHIQESIYDLSPSLSEFERNPHTFSRLSTGTLLEPYYKTNAKAAEIGNNLEEYYHGGIGNDRKREHFRQYTGGSNELNRFLINTHLGKSSDTPIIHLPQQIRNIDQHLDEYSSPAPFGFHVYTGVGGKLNILKHRTERSDRMYLPAYTSTSIRASVAESFASSWAEGIKGPSKKYREIVRLHIPQDSTHGTYLGSTGLSTGLGHEHEFLIGRGHVIQFMGEPRMSIPNNTPILVHDARIIRQVRKPL